MTLREYIRGSYDDRVRSDKGDSITSTRLMPAELSIAGFVRFRDILDLKVERDPDRNEAVVFCGNDEDTLRDVKRLLLALSWILPAGKIRTFEG